MLHSVLSFEVSICSNIVLMRGCLPWGDDLEHSGNSPVERRHKPWHPDFGSAETIPPVQAVARHRR